MRMPTFFASLATLAAMAALSLPAIAVPCAEGDCVPDGGTDDTLFEIEATWSGTTTELFGHWQLYFEGISSLSPNTQKWFIGKSTDFVETTRSGQVRIALSISHLPFTSTAPPDSHTAGGPEVLFSTGLITPEADGSFFEIFQTDVEHPDGHFDVYFFGFSGNNGAIGGPSPGVVHWEAYLHGMHQTAPIPVPPSALLLAAPVAAAALASRTVRRRQSPIQST